MNGLPAVDLSWMSGVPRTDNGYRERNSSEITNGGHHHTPTAIVHGHTTSQPPTPTLRRPSIGDRQHSRENVAPTTTTTTTTTTASSLISGLAATGGHATPAPLSQPPSNHNVPQPRRSGSWLSNLSSKISAATHLASHNSHHPPPSPHTPTIDLHQNSPTSPDHKPASPGFFIQTLRRLSTPGSSARPSKPAPVVQCERMVLNKNHTRERCKIPDLDGTKLRKVAFSLDVQVAPNQDEEERKREAKKSEAEQEKSRQERKERRERREQRRRSKDGELAAKEAAAAAAGQVDEHKEDEVVQVINGSYGNTHVNGVLPDPITPKTTNGIVDAVPETKHIEVDPVVEAETEANVPNGVKVVETKSEEAVNGVEKTAGTPERKEESQTNALRESKDSLVSSESKVAKDSKDEKAEVKEETYRNRPVHRKRTKNPALIYKRCCELRESSILDSILGKLSDYNSDGSIGALDLTKVEISVSDAPAFSDFLTLVPIKRLVLENCKLTDEAVRVILAGLLAVRRPGERNSKASDISKSSPSTENGKTNPQRNEMYGGYVESLVLSNNPKLTKQGWNYVSLFVHMCHSLKALDMSKTPIPKVFNVRAPTTTKTQSANGDIAGLFSMALSERLCKTGLEELNLNYCELSMEQVLKIMQGVLKSGVIRLGLAGCKLDIEGVAAVSNWMKKTVGCMAVDLSGNNLQDNLDMISSSIQPNSPFLCIVLSNCNLDANSLTSLLPTLAQLPNFRLLDLSNNKNLFSSQPDALGILRRYLPQIPYLKKLLLDETSMDADHAIALCEIIPDVKSISHLSMLHNPLYAKTRPASSGAEAQAEAREENAALFTAFVAMAKCSRTLVRVDVDRPPGDEFLVKDLSKKMLGYLLRNMEKGACDDWMADTVDIEETVLQDDDEDNENADVDDEDYVIGGTGVVKALGVCLTNTPNRDFSKSPFDPSHLANARAHEMSKALLSRARSIKARVESALAKNTTHGEMGKRRLLFLDDTLEKVIAKFEQEYPECRLPAPKPIVEANEEAHDDVGVVEYDDALDVDDDSLEDRDAYGPTIKPSLSRRGSDISLASKKKVNEEAQMLKLGKLLIQGEEAGCISCEEGEEVVGDVVARPKEGIREVEEVVEGVKECVKQKMEMKRGGEAELAVRLAQAAAKTQTQTPVQQMLVQKEPVQWTEGYLDPVRESRKE